MWPKLRMGASRGFGDSGAGRLHVLGKGSASVGCEIISAPAVEFFNCDYKPLARFEQIGMTIDRTDDKGRVGSRCFVGATVSASA
jgi:hypothetical protein